MKKTRNRRIIAGIIILSVFLSIMNSKAAPSFAKIQTGSTKDTNFKPEKKVSKKERDNYFSDSAFIGNSISKGLQIYFNSQGRGFLGSPVMLVQGSYSFANDKQQGSEYQITYQGKKLKAKDAIAAAKVKRVFINMGTNDLWKPSSQTYEDYVQYIKGIRKQNPQVVIFIQGTTPMCSSREKKYLNNSAIHDLNQRMKNYCSENKDLYYINISKGLGTASKGLKKKYSSDGYVHLTMEGYKIWTDNLTAYVNSLILLEKNATAAVKQAEKSKSQEDYNTAREWLQKLETSTVKQGLKERLKLVK